MVERLRRKLLKDSESGAGTFIFNFLMFPVLLAFFGLAFDYSAAFWARGALQQYLDAATQSAVGLLTNPTTTDAPDVSASNIGAIMGARAQQQYAINRYGTPFLACQIGGTRSPRVPSGYTSVTPADGCTYSQSVRPNFNRDTFTLTMNVHEETRYMFLRTIGFTYQGYNLRSTATLTTSFNNN